MKQQVTTSEKELSEEEIELLKEFASKMKPKDLKCTM